MTRVLLVLCMTIVVTVTGVLIWKAEATPLMAGAGSRTAIGGHLPVQKVGCMFGTHRCPAGTKWSCIHTPAPAGTAKKCICRPC
jgi:hypothetical protein